MASAYAARDYQSLYQYFIVRPHAAVFFYDAQSPNAHNIRLGMKPYFKQAKDNGYDCAHIGNHLIPQLRSQHNIKSLMGVIFFSYGKYLRHVEGLAGDIFQAQQQLPVYPTMKSDSVEGHPPRYVYQKPNAVETTQNQRHYRPDAAELHRIATKPLPSLPPGTYYQKPNQ